MPTGFRNSSGVDLDSLFAPYSSGTKHNNTGFRTSDGVDIAQRFQPGNAGITTGFRNSAGTDIGSLFARGLTASPNPVSGSASGPSSTGIVTTGTCSVSGNAGASVSWTFVSGKASSVSNSAGTAVTFTASGVSGQEQAIWRLTSNGSSIDVIVIFNWSQTGTIS